MKWQRRLERLATKTRLVSTPNAHHCIEILFILFSFFCFYLVEKVTANVENAQAGIIDAITSKRIKTCETRTSSLLLETPDILKNVYSFLTFKEALEIRRTCRHARQNDIDLFQYSHMKGPGYLGSWNYDKARNDILCNLKSTEALGAALSNKTLSRYDREGMLWTFVHTSKTDNAAALELLLQDEACPSLASYTEDPCELLDIVLQNDFVEMAGVLQKNDAIQASMKMCRTCTVNVGAFKCSNHVECCHVPPRSDGKKWDFYNDESPKDFIPHKYCRACVLASDARCSVCNEHTCPECIQAKKFLTCFDCKSIVCYASWELCSIECMDCKRVYCGTCNKYEEYIPECEFAICMPCRRATGDGIDAPWSDEDY